MWYLSNIKLFHKIKVLLLHCEDKESINILANSPWPVMPIEIEKNNAI